MQCSVATRSAHLHEEPEMIPFLEKPSYPIMKKIVDDEFILWYWLTNVIKIVYYGKYEGEKTFSNFRPWAG